MSDDGITRQTHTTLTVKQLQETVDLLRECATEIEVWVHEVYGRPHRSQTRRYEPAQKIVERAREQAGELEKRKPHL